MPSWNIHIAHAERLLEGDGPIARSVLDRNAFLFGNLIPDIYVGYMVPEVRRPMQYRVTHFAEPEHIPKPRAGEFWDAYVAPLLAVRTTTQRALSEVVRGARARGVGLLPYDPASIAADVERMGRMNNPERYGEVTPQDFPDDPYSWGDAFEAAGCPSVECDACPHGVPAGWAPAIRAQSQLDLALGVWVHLLADNIWNTSVNLFLDERGERPSRDFRIKKQGDFDTFGKSLAIDLVPRATPELIDAAGSFAQYAVDERSVYYAIAVAHETVRTNHLDREPEYRLLTRAFFERVSAEVEAQANALFAARQ